MILLAISALLLTVDKSDRQLTVSSDNQVLRTEPVAIGKRGKSTPTGTWRISRIDINPGWTPTFRGGIPTPPGHPDNPLGRFRFVFNPPYALHGNNDEDSIGGAVSRGCVRLRNEAAADLAVLLLKHTGQYQSDEWFEKMLTNSSKMYSIVLKQPVVIKIQE